ncbi:MAG: tetratricopeptide repeat protein [Planctomycetota bacterium]
MSTLKHRFIACFAFGLIAILPNLALAQLGGRDPEMVRLFEAGKVSMLDENWDEALVSFEEAKKLDTDRTFTELYFWTGEALRELEDYQNAIKNYTDAIRVQDDFAQAHNGLGICWREQGQYDVALNSFRNAEQYDRRDAAIAANLGDILINTFRDPADGMQYLDRAIELNPEDAEAYRNRGFGHALLNEFEEGIADLTKAAELDPSDYETYDRLASVHAAEEEHEKSIAALTKAIETYEPEESSDPDTYINGYLSRARERMLLAKEDEQTGPQREALYEQIVTDADAVLEEFPDRFPESGMAMFRKGLALRMQGLFAEAITAFTDALQIIPAGQESNYTAEAYLYRGICWFYQGQTSLARGDFKEAAAQSYADPLPHLWIGYTQAKDGEYRKAIESYGEAAAKSPSFALAYVNRGLAYIKLGDYEKAADNFNKAIRAEPTAATHYFKSGRAHEMLDRWDEALAFYNLALQRDGEFEEAKQGAARALRALGRPSLSDIQRGL